MNVVYSLFLYLSIAPTTILQDGLSQPSHMPSTDSVPFYPVPPSQVPGQGYLPQDHSGFTHAAPFQPQAQPEQPGPPPPQMGHMSPHMPSQMHQPPPQMNPHVPPSPAHMPYPEQPSYGPPEMQQQQPPPASPARSSLTPQMDFYDQMANMVCSLVSDKCA